jgi:NAD(P)-dependent dehydrogenase (short-subunit alcohol dehydrogenase family)
MTANRPQSQTKPKVVPLRPPAGPSRLAGRVAVITGGSRGIGYAIARALAREGANVVITGRDLPTLTKSAAHLRKEVLGPAKIVAMTCDVRAAQSVTGLFAVVKRRFGQLDILVNNAGISQPPAPLAETTLETWQTNIDTNLTGVFLCTRAALPLMKTGAIIINNLSAAAKQIFPNYYAYTAAKTGALGFTLTLRAELAPRGIRVTALVAGATATDIWQQIMPDAPRDHMMDVESIAQAVLCAVLLPPNVNPSEISLDPTGGAL